MALADHPTMDDFTHETFTHDGVTKDVHWAGEGPGVLFMHEVPGITPTNLAFAGRLVDAGYTVAMPDLIGTPGKEISAPYMAASMAKVCISREFQAFALKADRPVIGWLRALGRELHARAGGPGIGAVGMCLTGGFALALAVDTHVLAPVLSQPSLPVAISPLHARDIGLPDEQAEVVARRCEDEDLCLLGLRFRGDLLAPSARFAALRRRFGDAFEAIELDDGEWRRSRKTLPPEAVPPTITHMPHGVLGGDYLEGPPTRQALDRVLELFSEKLTA